VPRAFRAQVLLQAVLLPVASGPAPRSSWVWGMWPIAPIDSGGFGLRYALDPEPHIYRRIDVGLTQEGSEVYFQCLEAF